MAPRPRRAFSRELKAETVELSRSGQDGRADSSGPGPDGDGGAPPSPSGRAGGPPSRGFRSTAIADPSAPAGDSVERDFRPSEPNRSTRARGQWFSPFPIRVAPDMCGPTTSKPFATTARSTTSIGKSWMLGGVSVNDVAGNEIARM